MCLTGFTWLLSALAASSLTGAYTVGLLFGAAALATSVHVILAFPDGRLASTVERAVVALAYVVAVPLQILALLVLDPATSRADCSDCPPNALLVGADDTMANAIIVVQNLAAVAITVSVIVILARRWRGATSAARRTLAPVLLASSVTLAFGMLLFLSALLWSDGEKVARILTYAALAAVPLAFLVGLLRIRLASFNVIRLNAELARNPAPGRLREALARALGDPSLKLAYWLPETKGYADVHGRPIDELAERPDQVVRIVERDGRRIGAIVHDASLRDQPELVDAVAAAAALALRNEQLQAELLARLDQLSTSEERLRALIDASPLAIVEVDLDGRVTFWNRAAERLYGWTSEEVSGQELSFVPDPAERDELRARLFEGEAISDIETKRLQEGRLARRRRAVGGSGLRPLRPRDPVHGRLGGRFRAKACPGRAAARAGLHHRGSRHRRQPRHRDRPPGTVRAVQPRLRTAHGLSRQGGRGRPASGICSSPPRRSRGFAQPSTESGAATSRRRTRTTGSCATAPAG